jgi:hypothetical protein
MSELILIVLCCFWGLFTYLILEVRDIKKRIKKLEEGMKLVLRKIKKGVNET